MAGTSQQTLHDAVKTFEMQAPRWRPRLHPGSRLLGEPDIYIRSDDSSVVPEDEMSEANVKNGMITRAAVGNETFSAHDMIYDRLKGKAVMQNLSSLFDEVVSRRVQLASLRCGPAPSQYRHPQRVTLNEVKLAAYIKELADPAVPLRKLAKSVPHGYRGERMLDMLWNGGSLASAISAVKAKPTTPNLHGSPGTSGNAASNSGVSHTSVAIDRAVWFVRVVGTSEISSSRLRQANNAAYTAEWTGVLMGWLRRQIVELNIVHHHQMNVIGSPSASSPMSSTKMRSTVSMPSPLVSTPQRSEEPYALILEDDFCQRWTAKWEYGLSLLQALIYENLIDEHVATRAAIDMLRTANVVQILIALSLVAQFANVIVRNAALTSLVVDVLSSKIVDYSSTGAVSASNASLLKEMRSLLLYCIVNAPEALLSINSISKVCNDAGVMEGLQKYGLEEEVSCYLERVKALRNGFTVNLKQLSSGSRPLNEHLKLVKVLDDFFAHLSADQVFSEIFDGEQKDRITLKDRIYIMLNWATTEWRQGTYRAYLVANLLAMCAERQHSHRKKPRIQSRGGEASSEKVDMDVLVTAWITDVDSAQQNTTAQRSSGVGHLADISVDAATILIGELCRLQVFSFQKYLRKLTARGLTVVGARGEAGKTTKQSADIDSSGEADSNLIEDSIHSKILRNVALSSTTTALEHQRRIAIYGNRTKESYEEAVLRRAWREIYLQMTWLFSPLDQIEVSQASVLHLPRFTSSSPYVRTRIVQAHVQPMIAQFTEHNVTTVEQLEQVMSLYEQSQDYAAMAEFTGLCVKNILRGDEKQDTRLALALETFLLRHRIVWRAMGLNISPLSNQTKSSVREEPSKVGEKADLRESLELFLESTEQTPKEILTYTSAQLCEVLSEADLTYAEQIASWVRAMVLKGSVQGTDVESAVVAYASASESLQQIVLPFWQEGLISLASILKTWTIAVLPDDTMQLQAPTFSTVVHLIPLLESIFAADETDLTTHTKASRMRAMGDNLQDGHTLSLLVGLLCWRTDIAKAQPESGERSSALVRRIAGLLEVRLFVQRNMTWCVRVFSRLLPIEKVHAIMSLLFQHTWRREDRALSSTTMETICNDVDAFKWEQRQCEIFVLINEVHNDKTILPTQRNSQLDTIARSMTTGMLSRVSGVAARSWLESFSGMSRLLEPNGISIEVALLEAQFQAINKSMEATFVDEDLLRSAAWTASELLQSMHEPNLSIGNTVTQCLRLVTEWFESQLEAPTLQFPSSDGEDTTRIKQQRKALLNATYVRLSIVCSLLQLSGMLNNQSLKHLASRAFSAVARNILTLESETLMSEVDEEAIQQTQHDMLDVLAYMLQQAPTEVQHSMQARAAEHVYSTFSSPSRMNGAIASRMAWLLSIDNDAIRAIRSHMYPLTAGSRLPSSSRKMPMLVEGQSINSALAGANFAPVLLKSWEMHPNVDSLTLSTSNTSEAHHSHIAENNKTELGTLANNGPISLHHFGAFRTLDKMLDPSKFASSKRSTPSGTSSVSTVSDEDQATPPAVLDCEQSYGVRLGGEPVYARDARRGLLALRPAEKAIDEVKHLVPVLSSIPAHTPQTASKVFGMDESKELSALKAIANGSDKVLQSVSQRKRRKSDNATETGGKLSGEIRAEGVKKRARK
jgi:hypothetical protein